MPRDLPDWGALTAQKTVYEITDLGELAARLGSPVTFDRRGDVILVDSFEDGLNRVRTLSIGTGATVDLTMEKARSGLFAARLVAGSDSTRWSLIEHGVPFRRLGRIGHEASFVFDTHLEYIMWSFEGYSGSHYYNTVIRYYLDGQELRLVDENLAEQTFASGVPLGAEATAFHTVKIVVDLETEQYVRLLLDGTVYDLSDYGFYVVADATAPIIEGRVGVKGDAGTNSVLLVDDVILTENEP